MGQIAISAAYTYSFFLSYDSYMRVLLAIIFNRDEKPLF